MTTPATTAEPARQGAAGEGDWTYRRILDWTREALRKHGCESPRLEAEILLAHASDCQRILLYTRLDEPTPENVRATMRGLVQRRMKAEPVAYLIGRREFFSLEFDVTPDTLIPRPETETLVVTAADWLVANPSRRRVIDVGTGSGCVAAALAKQCPDASVVAAELSPDAAAVARANVRRLGLEDRVDVRESDLFSNDGGGKFDLVVSNPPYVRTGELAGLEADVRDHEPRAALDGGQDGLDVVRRLVAESSSRLDSGGRLLIEVDPSQIDDCRRLLGGPEWTDFEATKDDNGDLRVVGASRV